MNKEDVKELFKRIKALYPTFSANQYALDEWFNILKDYSKYGVNDNLTKYYKEKPDILPSCVSLINEFIKIEQKKRYVSCKFCRKGFKETDLEDLKKHEGRHLSVRYIKRKEHLVGKVFDESKLMNADAEIFDKMYDKFLELIYEKESNPTEKELIKMCISNENSSTSVMDIISNYV